MSRKKKEARPASEKKRSAGKAERATRSGPLALGPLKLDSAWQELGGDYDASESPLEQAQDLIYQAFEADAEEAVALALQALAISPDCADAYGVLSSYSESLEEAIDLLREGVAAGERALGKKMFREYEGYFWGMVETRPYMRARMSLAQNLWSARQTEEAVEHFGELLRLNPNDNQGVRYELAACLMELGRDDELGRLLKQYQEDDSAAWAYSAALLAFRTRGSDAEAGRLLAAAQKLNRFVPAYLLDAVPLPPELPEYIGRGDEPEAISYAATYLPGWKSTPGAITWLRSNLKVKLPKHESERPRGSWKRMQEKYAALPQVDEVWQFDICRPEVDSPSGVPWSTLLVDESSGAVLHLNLSDELPDDADLWDVLLRVMIRPKQGEPCRPQRIEVRRKSLAKQWAPKLQAIAVECRHLEDLPRIDEALSLVAKSVAIKDTVELNRREAARISLDELTALPQSIGETWQADFRQLSAWVGGEGGPRRLWIVMVASRDEGLVLAQDIPEKMPDEETLWQQLVLAIARPGAGEPHRPGVIQVSSEAIRAALDGRLESLGIRCVAADAVDQIDFMMEELGRHMAGPDAMTALVDVPGITHEQVAGFFSAAAEYYRAAPWRRVPGDTLIDITCRKFETDKWYAVVMGQSGMTLGLALYDDLAMLERLLSGQLDDEQGFEQSSVVSITFEEAFEISPRDLEAAERNGWEIAGPEAHPHALRVSPGGNVRPPLSWELELLEAALRALPEFVAGRSRRQTIAPKLASGPITLELAWRE